MTTNTRPFFQEGRMAFLQELAEKMKKAASARAFGVFSPYSAGPTSTPLTDLVHFVRTQAEGGEGDALSAALERLEDVEAHYASEAGWKAKFDEEYDTRLDLERRFDHRISSANPVLVRAHQLGMNARHNEDVEKAEMRRVLIDLLLIIRAQDAELKGPPRERS